MDSANNNYGYDEITNYSLSYDSSKLGQYSPGNPMCAIPRESGMKFGAPITNRDVANQLNRMLQIC